MKRPPRESPIRLRGLEEAVKALHQQGLTYAEIGRRLNLHPKAVGRFITKERTDRIPIQAHHFVVEYRHYPRLSRGAVVCIAPGGASWRVLGQTIEVGTNDHVWVLEPLPGRDPKAPCIDEFMEEAS